MKKILKTILLSIAVLNILNAAKFINIGTGGVTGTYYPTGGIICKFVNKYRNINNLKCSASSTGGSVFNVNAIKSDDLDFGFAQSDVAYQAYNGTGKFAGKPFKDLRVVMAVYPELLTLVASSKSHIRTLQDIKGKRVNVGNPGSGNEAAVSLLFAESSIKNSDLKLAAKFKSAEMPDALRDEKIDAYFFMVGHPTANIKDIASSKPINLVPLTGSNIDAMLEKYPYYAKGIIPGGLYNGIDKDTATYGVKALLVTTKQKSKKDVYNLVKAILDNFEKFKRQRAAYKTVTKKSLLEGTAGVPFHDGAAKYFKEVGLIQ